MIYIYIILLISLFSYKGISQEITSGEAPINKDYINYINDPSGNSGYIPAPVTVNFKNNYSLYKSDNDLPAVYDLRTLGFVSSVKDQLTCNSCWAFAVMGAIESSWLKKGFGEYDLSESNLKNCHNFDRGACDAGNIYMAGAYLSRGNGPVSELSDPYKGTDAMNCISNLRPVSLITELKLLPKDPIIIKENIIKYGALYTNFRTEPQYYNFSDNTYYYSGTSSANHCVTLVGWDDNKVTAGGTGAWIIKNSWGSDWAENGYFYISYNDTKVLTENAVIPGKTDFVPGSKVYSYDKYGWLASIAGTTSSGNTGYGVVKYTTTEDQFITKVGTYINTAGTNLEIEVYDNFDGSQFGNLLGAVTNLVCEFPGYYAFDLPEKIKLNTGTDFFVKVKYLTPNYYYPIPVEKVVSGFAGNATIEEGKCWRSQNGKSWFALGANTDYKFDLCIKVYAEPQEVIEYAIADFNLSNDTICAGDSLFFTNKSSFSDTYKWYINNVEYSTNENFSYKFNSSGTYKIKLSASNKKYSDFIEKNVLVLVSPNANMTPTGEKTICEGDIVALNVPSQTGVYYQWRRNGNIIFGLYNNTINVKDNGIYSVIVTHPNGCFKISDSLKLETKPAPKAYTGKDTSICAGNFINLGKEETEGNSYLWNSEPVGFSSDKSNPIVKPTITTTYTLTETILNSGCNKSNSVIITVNSAPNAIINPVGNKNICEGENILIKTNYQPSAIYQWKLDGKDIENATNTSYIAAQTGNYTVLVSVQGNCNTLSDTMKLTVNPLPVVNIINDTTICAGNKINLGKEKITGILYEWNSEPDGFISDEANPLAEPITTTTYTLTESYTNTGCRNTNTVIITVNPTPDAIISPVGQVNICKGEEILINAEKQPDLNYQWFQNGNIIPAATASVYKAVDSGTYNLLVKSPQNCSKLSDTLQLVVNPLPEAKTAKDTTICAGTKLQLGADKIEGNNYEWKSSPSGFISNESNPIAEPSNTTTYTLTETNINTGCKNTNSFTITVNAIPQLTLIKPNKTIFCQGEEVMLKVTSNIEDLTYQWLKNDIIINNSDLDSLKISETGEYSVKISDENYCYNTSEKILISINNLPSLSGKMLIDNQPVSKGIVELYSSNQDSSNFIKSIEINTNGIYNFNNVNIGTYIIFAKPDKISYPASVYTYYPNKNFWNDAIIISINNCEIAQFENLNINVNKTTEPEQGQIKISGYINQTTNNLFKNDDIKPIAGMNVKLQDYNKQTLIKEILTNKDGYYEFNNLPKNIYTILLDIPGFNLEESHLIDAKNSNSTNYSNINYIVDNDSNLIKKIITGYKIEGKLHYNSTSMPSISDTKLNLKDNENNIITTTTTDANGKYLFTEIQPGKYYIETEINKTWGGVDPVDALIINRKYLNLFSFTDKMKENAADVNIDKIINPIDALMINRRYLKLLKAFKAGDWLYQKDLIDVTNSDINYNIKAICFGDANGSYKLSKSNKCNIKISEIHNLIYQPKELINIPVYINNSSEIAAFGLSISYDINKIKINSIESKLEGLLYNILDNEIRIAWTGTDKNSLISGQEIFSINCQILNSNNLTWTINSESVFADINGEIINNAELLIPKIILANILLNENSLINAFNIYPNPIIDYFNIEFNLNQPSDVKIYIVNTLGQIVKTIFNSHLDKGKHTINSNNKSLDKGYYLIKTEINNIQITKSIIL